MNTVESQAGPDADADKDTDPNAAPPAEDANATVGTTPSLASMLQRDALIILLALSAWAAADAWYLTTDAMFAAVLSAVDGLVVGFLLAALLHEWGHYLAARLANAQTTLVAAQGASLARFSYDFEQNTQDQFRWMSIGGNIAHWAVFLLLWWCLPFTSPGQASLIAAVFGFAVFATTLEVPVIIRSSKGMSPLESLGKVVDTYQRNIGAGAVAAVALFMLHV